MKVAVLTENTACSAFVCPEHGLSLYLETENHKILFDMGQTDAFARNAEKLGIDLSSVDIAILSHGHYDHGGGLRTFLERNEKAKVYIHQDAFGAHYNGQDKFIGLDTSLRDHSRLQFTHATVSLGKDLQLWDCNDLGWQFDSWGLTRKTPRGFIPDPFTHEQYLLILEGERKILISGCTHKGIVNIANHFRPDVLIGGFHLNKLEDKDTLTNIAKTLLQYGGDYYTGHCTGNYQYTCMKETMADALHSLSTGSVFTV